VTPRRRPDLLLVRLWMTVAAALVTRPRRGGRERGDVPGWVMVTILSAVLVVGIIAVAKQPLQDLFTNAVGDVNNQRGK